MQVSKEQTMTAITQDNTMPADCPIGTHIAVILSGEDSDTYFYKRVLHLGNLYVSSCNNRLWADSGFTLSTLLKHTKKVVWVTESLAPLVEAWYQAQTKDSPVEKPSLPEPAKPVQGSKFDTGKPRFSLLPPHTLKPVLKVLEFGAAKYSVNNWQHVENPRERYYDAAMRHLYAWFNGEPKDLETGESHLAHAICCLLFLLWFESN